ncbi:MAG: aspartate kinase [Planctomycetota bacterium]|nr:aspartate kinase [Planctomycetota bacterium]
MAEIRDGLRVVKFGGTSVATAGQLRKVRAIVEADPRRRAIVVSAPGKAHPKDTKITDLLYLAHELASKDQPIDPVWRQIEERFLGIARELGLRLELPPLLAEAKRRIEEGASADYAASRGEAIHGLLCAEWLDAEYIDAAEVVFFDRTGRLDEARTYAAIRARCQGSRRVLIPGFYGTAANGGIKTFSRGGSDITGSIVAHALDAALYENWTDVSGFRMTDPRIVPDAKGISEITYGELRELSYMGANVLHEEAVFPVRAKGIPIQIKNTDRPEDPGTLIVAERDPGHQVVVGIAGTRGFTVIALEKTLMNAEVGFARRVLDVFASHGVSIEHMPTGIDTMSVVVSDRQLEGKLEVILEELQATVHPDSLKALPGMALIATVGLGMNHAIGTAARLFTALARARVNVRMIDQGSSEQNIIVGVEEDDLATAIRALYAEFA